MKVRIRLCPDPVEDQEEAALEAARAEAEASVAVAALEAVHAAEALAEDRDTAVMDREDRTDLGVIADHFLAADGFTVLITVVEAALEAC